MFPILPTLKDILARQRAKSPAFSDAIGQYYGWKFGMRINPISKTPQFHNGVDLPNAEGTPIYAPWDGIVAVVGYAKDDELNGNHLIIDHDPATSEGANQTAYCHMKSISPFLVKGTPVSKGELLGELGTTGASTGPHLHFVVRTPQGTTVGGDWRREVDPLPFLDSSFLTAVAGVGVLAATGVVAYFLYEWMFK